MTQRGRDGGLSRAAEGDLEHNERLTSLRSIVSGTGVYRADVVAAFPELAGTTRPKNKSGLWQAWCAVTEVLREFHAGASQAGGDDGLQAAAASSG